MLTSVYVGLLGLLYMKMSLDVIKKRRSLQISLGAGDNNQIQPWVSAHSNFAAYVPFLVAMLYALESALNGSIGLVLIFGTAILAGRILHYAGVAREKTNFKLRQIGMHLTLWPMLLMSLLLIYLACVSLFADPIEYV